MDEKNYKRVSASNVKFRLLSYQLFGPPNNSLKCYNGPCVDLSKKPLDITASNKSSNNLVLKVLNSEVNYCLICYSNNIDNKLDSINLKDLNKFLKILNISNKKSDTCLNDNKHANMNTQLDLILEQLTDGALYLCDTCNAGCRSLLQIYQQMEKLQQEVTIFKAKFLNAIKFSKSITENNEITNITEFFNKTVDKVRTLLVGGELTLSEIKEELINIDVLDMEENVSEEICLNDIDIDFNFTDEDKASDDDSKKCTEKMDTNKLRPKRRNKMPRKHKGKPGTKRLAVEDLKRTKSNKEYVKWRKMYGNKMSLTAYKKMRREDLSKLQNVIESKGIPGRSNIGNAGIKVNWVEKDNGKIEYLGFEVIKNEDGTFSCSLCIHDGNMKPSKTRKSIGDHIKRRHVEVLNGHICEKCDARFFFHYQLTQHVEEKHVGIECKTCGMAFANRSNLRKHESVKHEGIKKHICEHCGKGFGTKKDMTIHLRRHTGERPFVCDVCAQTFIDKQSMKTHIRKKHLDTCVERDNL